MSPRALQGLCSACLAAGALETAGVFDPATGSMPAMAGKTIGDYDLLEEIARGGMGVVFKARQRSLERIVAVKLILSGPFAAGREVQRFRTEAQAVAQLRHPNIVAIHEIGEHDGQSFFSMDYIEGSTLAQLVGDTPMPAMRAARMTAQIARAIHYAHERGIVHRDIKPSNLLVDSSGEPQVSDFGVARMEEQPGQTATGAVLGTPGFMAPEQAHGDRDGVGPLSDVYSIGAVLYHLATTRPPFVAETPLATMQAARDEDPVPPRTLNRSMPRDLETICLKCLETEPDRRYSSALALAEDLERFLDHQPIRARPAGVIDRTLKLARRHRAVFALSAAAVLLLIGGILATSWQAVRARNAEAGAKTEAARSGQTVQFLQRMLSAVSPEFARGRDTELMREILDQAGRKIDGDLAGQPEVEAQVRDILADTYSKLGVFTNAQRHAERALTIRERVQGTHHPDTLATRFMLAMLQLQQNRVSQADALVRQVLEVRRRIFGPHHRATLEAMNGMAAVLSAQGRYTDAERLLREAVLDWEQIGPDEPEAGRAMNHLGVVRYQLKAYPEAERWFRRVLDVQRRTLGEDHPDTLSYMNNLAGIFFAMEKLADAEDLSRRVFASEHRVRGPEHAATLRAQCNLANACLENGNLDEAERHARQALQLERKVLPPGHPEIVRTLRVLARICDRQGKQEEVTSLLTEIEQIKRNIGPSTLNTNSPAALPPKSTKMVSASTNSLAPSTASAPGLLELLEIQSARVKADRLFRAGSFAEAEVLYRRVLDAIRKTGKPSDENVLGMAASLARCLTDLAWATRTNLVPRPGGELVQGRPDAGSEAADSRTPFSNAREGESLLRQVLETRLQSAQPDRLRLAEVTNRLGFARVAMAMTDPSLAPADRLTQLTEAEGMLQQSRAVLESARGVSTSYRRDALSRLVRLYEAIASVAPDPARAAEAAKWKTALATFDGAGTVESKEPGPSPPAPTPP